MCIRDSKETAVHFMNQVDDADLAALMEDGKTKEEMPAVCSCSTKCEAGAVNTACPVCATAKSKCTGKAPEPPAETPEPEKEKPAGLNPAALVLLLAQMCIRDRAWTAPGKDRGQHPQSSCDPSQAASLPDQ